MYELAMVVLSIGVIFIAVAVVSASKLRNKNRQP